MLTPPDNGVLAGMLTRKQLAKELGVHERTVARYSSLPNGLPYLTIGGRSLYRVDDVREFLARRVVTQSPVRKA